MTLQRSKNYVFRLLKLRPRSEFELKQKLANRKFSEDLIEETLGYFKKIGLVNDYEFARFWISSRVTRPLGLRRLFYELKMKGVCEGIVKEVAQDFKESIDELEIVTKLAQERFRRIKEKDKFKAKNKVYAFLMRRGFSSDVIRQALGIL